MLSNLLGTKIGMTQLFDAQGNVVPVTAVNVAHWYVTQVKTTGQDGYTAIQIGLLRPRYHNKSFSQEWLKDKKSYFVHCKEIKIKEESLSAVSLGQAVTLDMLSIKPGDTISVSARSRGLGFQGVVKRWGFAGGPSAHGSKFHRKPGSSGNMRRQGEVLKGKRLPGRAGFRIFTVRGLSIVAIDPQAQCVFIKGSVPGKKDALITIKSQEASV